MLICYYPTISYIINFVQVNISLNSGNSNSKLPKRANLVKVYPEITKSPKVLSSDSNQRDDPISLEQSSVQQAKTFTTDSRNENKNPFKPISKPCIIS